jgi:hypothetical protein
MKKFVPYLIVVGVLALVTLLVILGNHKRSRKLDERITLKEKDKIPYGFAAAKELSASLFPRASFYSDENVPGYWEDASMNSNNQAVILVSGYFNADDIEISRLMRFVKNGNYVFIIAQSFSEEAQAAFHFSYGQDGLSFFGEGGDSLRVRLMKPSFSNDSLFIYPGRKFESWFENLDTAHTVVLGRNENNPNFIRLDYGDGSVFIHSAPLAFSNYFILHKNNIHYFEQAMSVIPDDVNKIIWNEYYLVNRGPRNRNENKEPNWLSVLLRYPEFRWGFGTLLFLLLLWLLLNSRRRQGMIPGHPRPKNDSLDFVKTMGRLYYDRKDHQNLAKKMSVYFLEHVRSTYKLPTHTLDEQFAETLQFKSGYPSGDLNEIISFVQYLRSDGRVSEQQLINFHNQLESFYQNT